MSYYQLKELLANQNYPLAIVDLDAVDKNFELFAKEAKANNKKIRIATKSIRVPELLKYLYNKDRELFSGFMCYRISEASFLYYNYGFDDLLIAYPEVSKSELRELGELIKSGCEASIIVDSDEHLDLLDEIAKEKEVKINIILDLDGSLKVFNNKINLGVRRSSIKDLKDLKLRLDIIKKKDHLNLKGIMLYEAQVAGLADNGTFNSFQNPIKKKIKQVSIPKIQEFRKQAVDLIENHGFKLEIINGGGSGSIYSSAKDPVLTEVTVGSGFLCSHLFSNYEGLNLTPAIFFAIETVRKPDNEYITCMGGGYIASGSMGKDRLPEVFLPKGIEATDIEGFGEVQTPFKIVDQKVKIALGDPVLLRHAKAGELAEHFNYYHIYKDKKIIGKELTYRGEGLVFI